MTAGSSPTVTNVPARIHTDFDGFFDEVDGESDTLTPEESARILAFRADDDVEYFLDEVDDFLNEATEATPKRPNASRVVS